MWFHIKQIWQLQHGAKHFLDMVALSNSLLTNEEKRIVFRVLHQGSYYYHAHIESILIYLMSLDNVESRMKAYSIIREVRSANLCHSVLSTRVFRVPDRLTCTGKTMDELIDINDTMFEPPLTCQIPLTCLRTLQQQVLDGPIKWEYPCHSQSVEHLVNYVTKAAKNVVREHRGD